MPVVARFLDFTKCARHGVGVIVTADPTVWVCFRPVARKGDKILCQNGSLDEILDGEETVIIGDKPVACKGDKTQHGGFIATGCPRVSLGQGVRISCKKRAAKNGAAFVKLTVAAKSPFLDKV